MLEELYLVEVVHADVVDGVRYVLIRCPLQNKPLHMSNGSITVYNMFGLVGRRLLELYFDVLLARVARIFRKLIWLTFSLTDGLYINI